MQSELSSFASEVFGTAGLPEIPDLPVVFVGPLGDQIPDDGVFKYTTITDLSDIGNVPERAVILFREEQREHLNVLTKHAALFGRAVQTLFGIPGSVYGPWFEDAAFQAERVAYGAFVAELRAASEIAEQKAANERSGTQIEKERYTKASGAVRYSNDIGTAQDDSDVDE